MNALHLLQPPRIAIGDGCAKDCVEYLVARGMRQVLLVTSSAVLPAIEDLLQVFKSRGVTMVPAPVIDREPTIELFETVLEAARGQSVGAVVGIGGGSVIDVAKLAAALGSDGPAVREVFGIDRLPGRAFPLVCLPTTAGTGAEVSPNAILLDQTEALKKGVVSPHLVPDAAFVDPRLTLSVPPAVTAATGMDALTHCIEAYTNRYAHPAVDLYALQGIRLIAANLVRAVRDGADLEARGSLALGSLYGGLCLGPVNTAAVHALAYPLGGRFQVPHGLSNAVLLPAVSRFNLPAAVERYAEIALALGIEPGGGVEATARAGVEALTGLSRDCQIPGRLGALGVPRDALPAMARAAMQVTRLLRNNPRPLTEEDALQIYEASY
jgi:alcohol dehydrogenase class IV